MRKNRSTPTGIRFSTARQIEAFDTFKDASTMIGFGDGSLNELPRRKQRGITEGSDRFNVASDGVLDPMLRNERYFLISLLWSMILRL